MHNIQKSGPLTDPRFRIQGLGTGAKRETLGLSYAYLQLGRLKRNYETFLFFFFFGSSFNCTSSPALDLPLPESLPNLVRPWIRSMTQRTKRA